MKTDAPVPTAVVSTPMLVQRAEPQSFHWNQLASADYCTYIKNLRAIGCPEATVHAIIVADVHARYRKRGRELEQKLTDFNNSSWSIQLSSFNSQQNWQAELHQLPDDEASEITDLLGLQPAPAREVAADTTPPSQISSRSHKLQNLPILMPLVMQNVDASMLSLTDQQRQVINELRQRFGDEIGGPNQDPNDLAYLERWQQAQPQVDSELRGMLGTALFENYQLAAQHP